MGASLLRKILCRKDYIKITSGFLESDEKTLNDFLKKIRDNRGKVIKINPIVSISTGYAEPDGYSPAGQVTSTKIDYCIHYKCYKEIKKNNSPKTLKTPTSYPFLKRKITRF